MTLFELGLSNGSISLATLLDGDETSTLADEIPIPELGELACIGGWPALVGSSVAEAQGVLAGYLDSATSTRSRAPTSAGSTVSLGIPGRCEPPFARSPGTSRARRRSRPWLAMRGGRTGRSTTTPSAPTWPRWSA